MSRRVLTDIKCYCGVYSSTFQR